MSDVGQPGSRVAATPWRVRPFGQTLGDIALDPLAGAAAGRSGAGTCRLPRSCRSAAGEEALLAWPVSHRLQGLLAVTIATRGDHWVTTRHLFRPCLQRVDGPAAQPERLCRSADPTVVPCELPDGRSIELTVPTPAPISLPGSRLG